MSLLVKGKKQKKWCCVSVAWCGLSLLVRGEIKLRVVVLMLRCCVDIVGQMMGNTTKCGCITSRG